MRILVVVDDPGVLVSIIRKFPNRLQSFPFCANTNSVFKRSYVEITLHTSTPGGLYFSASVLSDKRVAYLLFDQGSIPVEVDDLEVRLTRALDELNKILSED